MIMLMGWGLTVLLFSLIRFMLWCVCLPFKILMGTIYVLSTGLARGGFRMIFGWWPFRENRRRPLRRRRGHMLTADGRELFYLDKIN